MDGGRGGVECKRRTGPRRVLKKKEKSPNTSRTRGGKKKKQNIN